MSENTEFFHLPLDEIRAGEGGKQITKNVGKLGSDAIVHGNPQIVYDSELGACMAFDGKDDYVELVNLETFTFKNGATAMAWVRYDELQNWSRIFGLNTLDLSDTNRSDQAFFYLANKGESATSILNVLGISTEHSNGIVKEKWQHIAATYSTDGKISLLFDGIQVATNHMPDEKFFAGLPWQTGFVAKSAYSRWDANYKGRMANFRLYNEALSQAQIQDLMEADLLRNARIRETTLLKADLYTIHEDDHKPLIFIEAENRSEPLELAIANPGGKPVNFVEFDAAATPDEDKFHLQLRFRRNVIAERIRTRLQDGKIQIPGWKYAVGTATDQREDFISFIKEEGTFSVPNDGQSQLLTIPEFSAAARGGARNTRVEIRFRTKAQDPGSIIRHMEIQSHLGLKTVPLTARIVGSNTVLSNALSNTLTIQVNPTDPKPVKLVAGTTFEMVVDEALISGNLLNAEMTWQKSDPSQNAELEPEILPGQGHQVLSFKLDEPMEVTKDTNLEIQIKGWATPGVFGLFTLLLRYEGIPGYWDGGWDLPVQLSPLVTKRGNVGIGTNDPQAALDVKGETKLGGNLTVGSESTNANLLVHGNTALEGKVGVGTSNPQVALDVKGEARLEGNLTVGSENTNADLDVHGRIKDQAGDVMPVGAIIAYGGKVAPPGWLI
ncbi:MAG: LamG domain-containing protein, partial [Bacteroidetes bacterium]